MVGREQFCSQKTLPWSSKYKSSGVKWESKKESKTYFKAVSAKQSGQLEAQYQRYSNLRRLDRDPASVLMVNGYEVSDGGQFMYFKVLVQEFHARVDQCFINAIGSFLTLNEKEANHEELIEKDRVLTRGGLKEIAEQFSEQGAKDFFDMLHFSPIKLHLSFSLSADSKVSGGSLFNLLLQSFGVTFTEIQDAVLKLDYFEKSNTYLTMHQLTNEASSHYFRQTLKQIYVVVLGLDVIGNPVGLLTGFTTGVGDFFYEPLQGAIQGPEEFAEGLATGVRSLIGHTVGGAAGAVSRITGTLGKGIAALTMDEEYQRRRRLEQNRRPNDIAEGIAQGGRDLVMVRSLFDF
ncbi:hypothetical protein V5799_014046 [Amblyomma americanum]|uniref:Vacuolar protein sorting-associated protein 13 DH-like domain-containing protein n=1 Tax=Amblyomma americanum TaxID=6943 RepID=A0AAQ4E461_AMBAM